MDHSSSEDDDDEERPKRKEGQPVPLGWPKVTVWLDHYTVKRNSLNFSPCIVTVHSNTVILLIHTALVKCY